MLEELPTAGHAQFAAAEEDDMDHELRSQKPELNYLYQSNVLQVDKDHVTDVIEEKLRGIQAQDTIKPVQVDSMDLIEAQRDQLYFNAVDGLACALEAIPSSEIQKNGEQLD